MFKNCKNTCKTYGFLSFLKKKRLFKNNVKKKKDCLKMFKNWLSNGFGSDFGLLWGASWQERSPGGILRRVGGGIWQG